ncbi:hypothetical protein R3W88_019645 [Solanum pinnatisectum]|uniref:S-protein homolog n=1 Tax=Solanum pinnatisectum TaxID=50273 RepID=A0AAV9KJU0_9SOLN|nr:hypothetical protein R3W88_019645 [Solanum pinnatisectum]
MKSSQFNLPTTFLVFTIYYSCSLVQCIQFTVLINNELTANLGAHCIIMGFDDGTLPIPQGTKGSFPVNFGDPKQEAIASFALTAQTSEGVHGTFVLFDNNRDSQRCENNICEWHVKNDGLYLNIQGNQVLQFKWSS